MQNRQFKPGFRLSVIDVFVLLLGLAAVFVYLKSVPQFSAIIFFVVLHFFLFCNLVRMSRLPELLWASLFLMFCLASLRFDLLPFYMVFILSAIFSVLLILFETRKKSYHGIYWQALNPDLRSWFESTDKD